MDIVNRMKFDQVLPAISEIFAQYQERLSSIEWVIINRDLFGRVRLILPSKIKNQDVSCDDSKLFIDLSEKLSKRLHPHSFPASQMLLFEQKKETAIQGTSYFFLSGFKNVWVVDRLIGEADWGHISPVSTGAPRIVFFSIKGGVGRSTALATAAWKLAQDGKKVMVLDLDLESPGLSTSLLPEDRQPKYGITDWLVEDLLDNGDSIFDDMKATSLLSHDGEIYIVPAHGLDPGDYISKMGRVWMSKLLPDGKRENWSSRLKRLVLKLENEIQPDVILIDSRAGIDEIASSCITDLGASLVLLFAIDGRQTWGGYDILFKHWLMRNAALEIRTRLQIVAALLPETDPGDYFKDLLDNASNLFSNLYDEVPAGANGAEFFNFDKNDDTAPHYPWPVKWHRSFVALKTVDSRLSVIDSQAVQLIFGTLVDGITDFIDKKKKYAQRS